MTSHTPWFSLKTLSLVLMAMIGLTSCAFKPLPVNFSELGNHSGQLVTVKGCLGENITLQQILNQGLPQDSKKRFFNFYEDCKKTSATVVLVFENDGPYVDLGATIQIIGQVEVTASGSIYLLTN